jgi:hypothetical protein
MESENLPKLSPVPFPNGIGDLLFLAKPNPYR